MGEQKRHHSLLETVCSTAFGYLIGVGSQIVVFPWFGIHIAPSANFGIAAMFTVISLVRGYVFRRLFNALT